MATIYIVVEGGVVQSVYAKDPDETVEVLDLDNAKGDGTVKQVEAVIASVNRDMHAVY